MGCCCSTSMKSETHVPKRKKHQFPPKSDQYHRRAPTDLQKSLPIHDEETVKEVLSETHFPKSPSQLQKTAITITHNQHYTKKDELPSPEEIATENSDFRSLTDSLSTTTRTTVAEENKDDDGEVNQRRRISHKTPGKVPRKRSIPGRVTGGGVGRSPLQRSAQLPVKTAHTKVSSVQTPPVRLRSAGSSTSLGRDTGDFSRRGIRTPVRRDEAGALALHGPARQRSPNNVKPLLRKRMQAGNVKKEENDGVGVAESAENPIVSLDLECFIFL